MASAADSRVPTIKHHAPSLILIALRERTYFYHGRLTCKPEIFELGLER